MEKLDERDASCKLGLPECYLHGKLNLVLRRRGVEVSQYGFVFHPFKLLGKGSFGFFLERPDAYVSGAPDKHDEPFMLSSNVKEVNGEETVIPSWIGVEAFDGGSFAAGKPLFAFAPINPLDGVKKAVETLEYREVHFSRRSYAVATSEACCEQIQAASNTIQNCSGFGAHQSGKWDFFMRYKKVAAVIQLALYDRGIGVLREPIANALLQDWELGFGPLDSCPSI